MNKLFLVTILITLVFISCNNNPNVENIKCDLKLIPFFEEIKNLDTSNIKGGIKPLMDKYPDFMKSYNKKIMHFGSFNSKDYSKLVYNFLIYEPNKDIYKKITEVYPDFKDIKQELTYGFKHYKYYFPKSKEPDIFLIVSGFSQSIAIDSSWIAVSLEQYLGKDCEFYQWLKINKYMRQGKNKYNMVPDIFRAIALSDYPFKPTNKDLINNMIYKGKIIYFAKKMLPSVKTHIFFRYTKEQMDWCEQHEEQMWASVIEWQHLFKNEYMLIKKYTDEAPFTAYFGNSSAPRAANYLGYKIVESFMKNNKNITLPELMKINDGRKILSKANYHP